MKKKKVSRRNPVAKHMNLLHKPKSVSNRKKYRRDWKNEKGNDLG